MSLTTVAAVADTRAAVAALRGEGRRVALVPTMGALHDGHLALVARAHEVADAVVASVFVNPLQFGPAEDFDRYPRTLAADAAALEAAGVDLLFAPSVADMYPEGGTQVTVSAGPVGSVLEGSVRPGHFDGMLTVVAKLLHIVAPDVVLFGRKDAQQVYLVRRMITDLDLPVAVEVVPTVREADGLARSSRNRYLSEADRVRALALSAALTAAAAAADHGVDDALAAARAVLDTVDGVALDYLVAVDPVTFQPVDDRYRGPALVLVAARVGGTRLIDNELVSLG
jgi:pantoate--beta-alanine ligase